MLTLDQRMLIKRVEAFASSPFAFSLTRAGCLADRYYLVSSSEMMLWLSIPFRHVAHLKHVQVGLFSSPDRRFSRSDLVAISPVADCHALDSSGVVGVLSSLPSSVFKRLKVSLGGAL